LIAFKTRTRAKALQPVSFLDKSNGVTRSCTFALTWRASSRILLRVSETRWFVAHTKPRREKKVVEYCSQQIIPATLPCYNSAHKYRGKTVVFRKPLFPGYVFLQCEPAKKDAIRQSDHVANLLEVFDQETFQRQLDDILLALETEVGVRLVPSIGEGMRVRIKGGPLQGVEGWVEKRHGMTTVLLRLDFISQAAAIKIDADLLDPI